MTKRTRRRLAPFGQWMQANGYTPNRHSELAEALGCTRGSIYQYAAGKVLPRPEMLSKLTALTGLPLEAFVHPFPKRVA